MLLILGLSFPVALGNRGAPTVSELLDLYSSGRFDEAINQVLKAGAEPMGAFLHELKKDAPPWALAAGSDVSARRRLVAATFALDVAHSADVQFHRADGLAPDQAFFSYGARFEVPEEVRQAPWSAIAALVEWACGWLRSQPVSDPLERNWFLASVQVFRDFRDSSVARINPPGQRDEYRRFPGHLGHAAGRFRDEPWFRVVSAERQALPEWLLRNRHTIATASNPGAWDDLQEMQSALVPLRNIDSVRGEIDVHLGCVAILCGQHDRAREYLDDVDVWTSDACFRYLGHYLRGWVDELDGRRADAERGYATAAVILPEAKSGLTSLSVLLEQDGDRVRAGELAAQALAAPRSSVDPWVELWDGGACTRWTSFITPLHEGILRWAGR